MNMRVKSTTNIPNMVEYTATATSRVLVHRDLLTDPDFDLDAYLLQELKGRFQVLIDESDGIYHQPPTPPRSERRR